MSLVADNPISTAANDVLGRAKIAETFARQILSSDASEGFTVGVLGPWGSGKTSFVNLAREHLSSEATALIEFNPWMFSGAEQLVHRFFIELGAQLKMKSDLGKTGDNIQEFGDAIAGLGWLPIVGPWISRVQGVSSLVAKALQRRRKGVSEQRENLTKELSQLDRPIIVVIDDIDRLAGHEIREVFKLVRLTASFPNIVYVVAFDRRRVEQALTEDGVPGRDYLEKIIQLAVDLPAIPEAVLERQVAETLEHALAGIKPEAPFDGDRWPDIYAEIISPLLRNMRDVRRYAAAVRGTMTSLEGRIETVDVLALEAVRVFLPNVSDSLHQMVQALTTISNYPSDHQAAHVKAIIELAGQEKAPVEALLRLVFPASSRYVPNGIAYAEGISDQWIRDRRVAHHAVLHLYLERTLGQAMQAYEYAEHACSLMGDRTRFDEYLRSIDREEVLDAIASMTIFESGFQAQHATPATIVLLNLLDELPNTETRFFGSNTRERVGRVVYRVLRSVPDVAAVDKAVNEIMPSLNSLSAKEELLRMVGHHERRGHAMTSEATSKTLEESWRTAVRASTVESLIMEPELLRVLHTAVTDTGPDEEPVALAPDPRLTEAVLLSARTYSHSQSANSRKVHRSPRLAWDSLVRIYGGEDVLSRRIEQLVDLGVAADPDLLSLAGKYKQGWRPGEFGENE